MKISNQARGQTRDDRNFFFGTRARAREKFLESVHAVGGLSRVFVHPQARDPDGMGVTLDFGWVGPRDARNVVLSMSGTHGLEAFAGSAAQNAFLHSLQSRALPGDTAALFVHGYNGFGWSHSSRANESNVDLNRNMFDFSKGLPANPLYDSAVHDLFAPRELAADPVAQMNEGMQELTERLGYDALIDAINRGQYTRADGVYYGGIGSEWSSTTLLGLLPEFLPLAKRVVCIDWHTGMGAWGEPFFICHHDPGSASFAEAARIWGREQVADESGFADAERPSYQGLVIDELERRIESLGARMVGAVIEFGTYEPDRVEAGIMIDRALRFDGGGVTPARVATLRQEMQDTFNPDSERWRESVATHSLAIYERTIAGIA